MAEPVSALPQRQRPALRVVLLVAVVAVIPYLNALENGFVLDDELIEKDVRIHSFDVGAILREGYWARINPGAADVYRPLTVLSFALNYTVAGEAPAAFRAVNLVLHAIVSVLVLLLLDTVLEERRLALAAALLFATHPVHTEAVTAVSGRGEILAAGLLLAALLLHARGDALAERPRHLHGAVALTCFLLALLAKENVVAGPGFVLLLGLTQGLRTQRVGAQLWRALPLAAGFALIVAVYLVQRYNVLGTVTLEPLGTPGLLFKEPIGTRLLTSLEVLVVYLKLLIWPVALSADYSYRQIPILRSLEPVCLLGMGLAAALMVAFVVALRRRLAPVVFAIGFFALSYAPVSNSIVPIGVLVAERLLYLPSVAFCTLLAWGGLVLARHLTGTREKRWARVLPAGLLALVVVLYGVRTAVRNRDWFDEETLYAATAEASPESAVAHYRYGTKLLARPSQLARARDELERSLEIAPTRRATINLVHAYLRLDAPSEAAEVARRGLERWPDNVQLQRLAMLAQQQRELR